MGKIVSCLVLVALVALVGLGCETVPKKDYDALASKYNKAIAERNALQSELAGARSEKEDVQDELAALRGRLPAGASIHLLEGRPAIRMQASLLYASGSAKITSAGATALRQVASILKTTYRDAQIRVEGHTDTDLIKKTKSKYDTNWDLGSKRANEVVVFLTTKCGINPKRIYSASYGMHSPISNSRSSNRRVEIVILPPISTGSGVSTGSMTGTSEDK